MASPFTLVLASASPARLRTLRAAGIDAQVLISGVDESAVTADRPAALAAELARLKAEAAVARIQAQPPRPDRPVVLGCDSLLEVNGEVLGKPASAAEAVRRWRQMRGGTGVLLTGHCLIDTGTEARAEEVAATTVRFADITDAEIEAYVATGEPLRVAGAFTIDGLGGWFIDGVDGDAGNVVGVSLPLLRRMLGQLGIGVVDLWRPGPGSGVG